MYGETCERTSHENRNSAIVCRRRRNFWDPHYLYCIPPLLYSVPPLPYYDPRYFIALPPLPYRAPPLLCSVLPTIDALCAPRYFVPETLEYFGVRRYSGAFGKIIS